MDTTKAKENGLTKAAAQGHERDYKTLKVLEKNISRIKKDESREL